MKWSSVLQTSQQIQPLIKCMIVLIVDVHHQFQGHIVHCITLLAQDLQLKFITTSISIGAILAPEALVRIVLLHLKEGLHLDPYLQESPLDMSVLLLPDKLFLIIGQKWCLLTKCFHRYFHLGGSRSQKNKIFWWEIGEKTNRNNNFCNKKADTM